MKLFATLRARLLVLMLLGLIPAVAAVLWLTEREREHAILVAEDHLRVVALEISREHERQIEATLNLLKTLPMPLPVTAVQKSRCNERLSTFFRNAPPYLANLGIVSRDGEQLCSALPMPAPISIADRLSYRGALETGRFSVGVYQQSRIDGRPILDMALPVQTHNGTVLYLDYATLDLSWFNRYWARDIMQKHHMPEGSSLLIVDREGKILVSFPADNQWNFGPVLERLINSDAPQVFEATGPLARPSLFAASSLGIDSHKFAKIAVGIPVEAAMADPNQHRHNWLLILAGISIVLLAITAVFSEYGILRRLQPLFASLEKLSRGEYPSANKHLYKNDELGRLAVAVDNLTEQLLLRDRERDDANRTLRESEERYRVLYKETPAMLHSIDREGKLIHVSNLWLEKLGYRREEVLGRKSIEFLTEESRRYALDEVLPAFFASGACTDIHYQMVTRSGETIDVLLSAVAVRSQDGEVTHTLASLIDVTEKLKAEKVLRQTSDLLNAIFLNAPLTIMVLDRSARVIKTNLKGGLSFKPDIDQAGNLDWLCGQIIGCATPEEEHNACGEGRACQSCPIRTGICQTMAKDKIILDHEITMHLLAGGRPVQRDFLLSVIPLNSYEDETFLVTLNDITERKQNERARLEIERQALQAQKLESLGLMAGSIAHDFNNLLMAILGHLDLLANQIPVDSPLLPRVARARRATRQAADLTAQLLAYAGKGTLRTEPVNVADLVDTNIGLLQVLLSKKITFCREIDEGLPQILADPGQLQQVVMNLVTNAAEAIGDNPGRILLRLSRCRASEEDLQGGCLPPPPAGEFIVLEVTDTGCGMDEETRKHIFDPFFSTKRVGRGLGMASLLGIVRNMQGAIFITSSPGQGTTIRLLFPVNLAITDGIASADAQATNPEQRFSGTLLVIEDEEMVRLVTAEYAQMFGFDVLTATNGEEGVRLYCQHADRIACVLLDLHMPTIDGVETFHRIRQVDADARVILTSGYLEEEATARFKGEGLSAFLQKPYDREELRRKLFEAFRPTTGSA